MVKQVFRLIYIATVLLMVGCTPELDEVCTTTDSQDSIFTYTMYFDSPRPSYDGTTRINNAGEWENGDMVFLYLLGPNEAYAQAEYNSSSKNWTVTSSASLASVEGADCHIWCAEGKNPVQSSADGSKYYQYDYMTAAFSTTYPEGKYTCSNNGVIFVNAILSPRGWRIRFKGNPGTKVRVEESYDFYHKSRVYYDGKYDYLSVLDNFELTVGNDGYTDYFAGSASPKCSQIRVTNVAEGITYNRHFDQETLTYYGGSGCYTIPTASNLHGWTREGEPIHEYVDLGLPSGTLWATCNLGATLPEEYGDYFAWGETAPKAYFDPDNYKFGSSLSSLSKYSSVDNKTVLELQDDAAYVNWGKDWRMPSKGQMDELRNNCTWIAYQSGNSEFGGVAGLKVVGPNGKYIFLPAAGMCDYASSYDIGAAGYYWSNTLHSYNYHAYSLDCVMEYESGLWNYHNRCEGLSIRPVYFEEQVHEYVDLGLPSGLKWATCNVGASSPEEYGDYFAWGETEPKEDYYSWSTYKWCNGTATSMTKYCTDSRWGTVDNKSTLGPEDDAAHVNWGGAWRLPTIDEQKELLKNCSWTLTTQNGILGSKVIGPNGNSIFLPAAGCRNNDRLSESGSNGDYWSSSFNTNNNQYAYFLAFYTGSKDVFFGTRYSGHSVRPVCP